MDKLQEKDLLISELREQLEMYKVLATSFAQSETEKVKKLTRIINMCLSSMEIALDKHYTKGLDDTLDKVEELLHANL